MRRHSYDSRHRSPRAPPARRCLSRGATLLLPVQVLVMLPRQVSKPAPPTGPTDQERILRIHSHLFLQHPGHSLAEALSNAQLPLLQQVPEDPILLLFQRSLHYLGHCSLQMNRQKSFKRVLHETRGEMRNSKTAPTMNSWTSHRCITEK